FHYKAPQMPQGPDHLELSFRKFEEACSRAFGVPQAIDGDMLGSRIKSDSKLVDGAFELTLIDWEDRTRDVCHSLLFEIYGMFDAALHIDHILQTHIKLTRR